MLGSATVNESGTKVSSRLLHRYLLADEDIVIATRQHWARLAEPAITVFLGFLIFSFLTVRLEESLNEPVLWLWWGWFALVARLIWRLLEWRNEWFVATDKRLLLTYGLFTHKVAMMPLRKVTDMNYGRSVTGRVLGYGTFTMESAGQDQAMRQISWVPNPDDTYKSIVDIIFGPDHGYEDDEEPVKHDAAPWGGEAAQEDNPQDDEHFEFSDTDDDFDDEPEDDVDITGEIPIVSAPGLAQRDQPGPSESPAFPVPDDALGAFEDEADDIPEEFPAADAKAIDLLEDDWRPDSWRQTGTRPEPESSYEVSGEDTTSFVRVQRDPKPNGRPSS